MQKSNRMFVSLFAAAFLFLSPSLAKAENWGWSSIENITRVSVYNDKFQVLTPTIIPNGCSSAVWAAILTTDPNYHSIVSMAATQFAKGYKIMVMYDKDGGCSTTTFRGLYLFNY